MDDFFLIHHDKAYLQECRKQIEAFVQARGLSLNAKTNIFPLKHGVDFLGFHTYLTESGAVIRKVRRRSKNNMKRKLKKLAALHAAGRIDAKTVEQSYQSWRGHAEDRFQDRRQEPQRLPVEFRNADYGKNHSVNVLRRKGSKQQQQRSETIRQ